MTTEEEKKILTTYKEEAWAEEILKPVPGESLPWHVKLIATLFKAMAVGFRSAWNAFFEEGIMPIMDFIARKFMFMARKEEDIWNMFTSFLVENSLITEAEAKAMLRFKGTAGGIQTMFNILMMLTFLGNYTKTVAEVSTSETRQKLNAEYRPRLPNEMDMMRWAFMFPQNTAEARDVMKRSGLKDKHIDALFQSQYKTMGPGEIRDLFFRGKLDDRGVYERMRKNAIPDQTTDELKQLWDVIPPLPDIIRMAVKEAFSPEIAEKFGQYEGFPSEVGKWAATQGLNEEWAKKYWAAHWELPGVNMGYEMLHRGVIDDATLDLLMKALDIMPFWRDKLKAISFQPFTRVDIRRMHQYGTLGDEDLFQAYKDIGYNEEKAASMVDFTIRLNNEVQVTSIKALIMRAYKDRMITADEVRKLLATTKLKPDTVDFMIAATDYELTLSYQENYVTAAKERYTQNIWDELTTRTSLTKLNLPGARIDSLMEEWKPFCVTERKLPSKTDLDKFFMKEVITEDVFKLEMYRLGYNFNYTDWYLKINKIAKGAAAGAKPKTTVAASSSTGS